MKDLPALDNQPDMIIICNEDCRVCNAHLLPLGTFNFRHFRHLYLK
jgi:hypothetical protein